MKNKMFTKYTAILTVSGLAINIILAHLIKLCGIPLFLDSVGTILVAALGGLLPGITVGFFSNFITALISNDPITCCYGILSMLIAFVTVQLSRRGTLKKIGGALISALIFAIIGGALGSVLTWIIYGFSFGEGISAPYVEALYAAGNGFPKFWAQFSADMLIDISDKLVTMALVFPVLRFFPVKYTEYFPLGYVYDKQFSFRETVERIKKERIYRKHSLRTKITALIMTVTVLLSVIAVTIGINVYRSYLIDEYESICNSVADIVSESIDGNKVGVYLREGESAEGYTETEEYLYSIKNNVPSIKYIYVYQIRYNGCHVVFDLDTDDLQGNNPGDVIEFDESFKKYLPALLLGQEIVPVVSNDKYGWLLTVYKPIYNDSDVCVAYAAADIGMDNITKDIYSFSIEVASMLFCVFLAVTVFSIWYCEKKVIEPISVLVSHAREFDYKGERNDAESSVCNANVKTGDELEEVFISMCRTEKEIAGYVSEISDKNDEIARMQRNIIYSLANMVENRDLNTGEHIKRTSAYVGIIGNSLLKSGYPGITPQYIELLTASAPLHDIGKIKISDVILNKPGKLTPEEFDIMKTHTTAGYNILKSALDGIRDGGYIEMAAEMAAYHHERWDGSGYPEGLSGTDIPLCARIMAVADVFDALTSKRSYKEAMNFDDAMTIIKSDAGTHFDPDVAAAFEAEKEKVRETLSGNK